MTTALRPSEVTRLCEGTQHIKNGWTAERRAEVVVDGETVHEDSSQAHPFDIWESLNGDDRCHCGEHVRYGYDGNPEHHRGMCKDCDLVRCDAYPGECAS